MGYAAAVAFVIGITLEHHLIGDAGETASGVGQFFVGLAALFAAAGSWMNNRKIGRGIDAVKEGAAKADDVAKAVGPANGTTVLELLKQIKAFEEYQHGRNHDVINHLEKLVLAVPLLTALAEQLITERRASGDA